MKPSLSRCDWCLATHPTRTAAAPRHGQAARRGPSSPRAHDPSRRQCGTQRSRCWHRQRKRRPWRHPHAARPASTRVTRRTPAAQCAPRTTARYSRSAQSGRPGRCPHQSRPRPRWTTRSQTRRSTERTHRHPDQEAETHCQGWARSSRSCCRCRSTRHPNRRRCRTAARRNGPSHGRRSDRRAHPSRTR